MDGAGGFSAATQGCDHGAGIDGIVEQACADKFFNQLVYQCGALGVVLIFMGYAGAFDFAEHDIVEVRGAGGVAFKVI